jgi:MFS family permease
MAVTRKRNRNVLFIGLLSFFGGISQDIFAPLLPIYLGSVLHFDKTFIGLADGILNSSVSIFKIVAGYLSDKLRSRKRLIFFGYFLSAISRPLLAIFSGSIGVLLLRFLDGAGKGIKDAPKDALLADSTVSQNRGKSFGVYRALDTFGSVVGPVLLSGLLLLLASNNSKYQIIFLLTGLPLIVTLLLIVFKVKETQSASKQTARDSGKRLPATFYVFLAIVLFFAFASSSDTFLILRSQDLGVGIIAIPLVYAVFNFIYASASIPLGSLSDRIGREKVIILGWVFFAVTYFGFALANQAYQAWILFGLYGVYHATAEGVSKAFIADIVGSGYRGRAYGIYNSALGLIALPSSFLAGLLWEKYGSAAPFLFATGVAVIAIIFLGLFLKFYLPQHKLANLN